MTSLSPREVTPKGLACDVALVTEQKEVVGPDNFGSLVLATADLLGSSGEVINLCEERLRFLVVFAAAMLRGRTTLLPPSRAPASIAELRAAYPGCEVVDDAFSIPAAGTPWHGDVQSSDFTAVIGHTSGSTGKPSPHPKSFSGFCATTALNAGPSRSARGTRRVRTTVDRRDRPAAAHVRPRDFRSPATARGFRHSLRQAAAAGRRRRRADGSPAAPRSCQYAGPSAGARRIRGRLFQNRYRSFRNRAASTRIGSAYRRANRCDADRDVRIDGDMCRCNSKNGARGRMACLFRHPARARRSRHIVSAPWLTREQLLHDLIEMRPDRSFTVVGRVRTPSRWRESARRSRT